LKENFAELPLLFLFAADIVAAVMTNLEHLITKNIFFYISEQFQKFSGNVFWQFGKIRHFCAAKLHAFVHAPSVV